MAPPSRWRWLTNGPCQGNDHFLAGGLLRDSTHDPLDPIHPDLQLHPLSCRASGALGHCRTGCLWGGKKPGFHPKPLTRNTRRFESGVIKSASHRVNPRPMSSSLPSCAQIALLFMLLNADIHLQRIFFSLCLDSGSKSSFGGK